MSELKEHLFMPCCQLQESAKLADSVTIVKSYYDKSEVDKVLAEKDKYIEKLKDSIGIILKSKTEQIMDEVLENVIIYGDGFVPVEYAMKLVAEIRHYKHKWLLAMAEWCNSEMGRETFACFRPRHTKEVWREEHKYWAKWRKIWFELYKKFKEE